MESGAAGGELPPIAIDEWWQEHAKEGRPFLWADASVRFTDFYAPERLLELQRRREIEPLAPLRSAGHSLHAATAPGLFAFVRVPPPLAKLLTMDSAAALLVQPDEYTRAVLKWALLCALTPACIAPAGSRVECVWRSPDLWHHFHGCHRFDQSLLSALAARQLFGPAAAAHRFAFTPHRLDITSVAGIRSVLEVRRARYFQVARMVRLDRDDLRPTPLRLECSLEQRLLHEWRPQE